MATSKKLNSPHIEEHVGQSEAIDKPQLTAKRTGLYAEPVRECYLCFATKHHDSLFFTKKKQGEFPFLSVTASYVSKPTDESVDLAARQHILNSLYILASNNLQVAGVAKTGAEWTFSFVNPEKCTGELMQWLKGGLRKELATFGNICNLFYCYP